MTQTKMSEETKANMAKATDARTKAVRRLIAAHQEEYLGFLGDERVSRGLPREQTNSSPAKLQQRKEKLEAQLQELNQKLGITTQPTN